MAELTARTVATMKPEPKRREVADGRIGSLYLVTGTNGPTSWVLRYRRPDTGKAAVLTIGRVWTGDADGAPDPVIGGHLTLAGARRLALDAKLELDAGRDPGRARQDARAARREAMADTFEDALGEYDRRHLSTLRTGDHVEANLRRECAKWLDRPVRSITRRDVRDLIDGIADRGTPVMANRMRDYLNAMFNWLVQREIVEANPVSTIAKTRETARDRVLSDDELTAVWKATDQLSPTACAMARILVLTGQRLGSVEAMKWSDLDLDAAIWTIPGSDMKMGKDHVVALAPRAAEILRALPRASEYVFAGRDGERRNGRSRFRQSWVKASGVENWSPHDLRRVIASGMARLGVALHVVELILDHRARSMRGVAAVYQRHSFADEQRHALEAWAAHVEALVSGDAAAGNVVRLR